MTMKVLYKLIVLSFLKKEEKISFSFKIDHIFSTLLGIITDVPSLVKEMSEEELIIHQGLYENTNSYKNLTITEKGAKYLEENLDQIIIPKNEFNEVHLDRIKKILSF